MKLMYFVPQFLPLLLQVLLFPFCNVLIHKYCLWLFATELDKMAYPSLCMLVETLAFHAKKILQINQRRKNIMHLRLLAGKKNNFIFLKTFSIASISDYVSFSNPYILIIS